jgi:DNA polymerase I-like protein with 3'-5' exonuclease and polymerase domains
MGRLLDICRAAAPQTRPAPVPTGNTGNQLCTVDLAGRSHAVLPWTGQVLPDTWLALDTETDLIQGREIPRLRLVSLAGNRDSLYLLRPDQLRDFLQQHPDRHYICHHSAFDFSVVQQRLGGTPEEETWWDIAGSGRLHDTMLLDQLLRIAQTDEAPVNRNLAEVAKHYCGLDVDKSDSHRTRFAELPADWSAADPGFFRYAALDALATLHVYLAQCRLAQAITAPYQLQVLPGVVEQFGLLTETVQVRAAIALAAVHRNGVQVDLQTAEQVQDDVWRLLDVLTGKLEVLALHYGVRDLFKHFKKSGHRKQTPAGVPQRNQQATQQVLQQIADQHQLEVPSTSRGISDSTEYWKQHRYVNGFVDLYCTWQEQAKLAQFFAGLKSERIHPSYQVLVRTGRTSCSNPNLQQLPRNQTVRRIITAAPDYQLLSADYSCLELRTLAQVCLRRFGKSVLAEMFQADPQADPHTHTAARLLGLSDEQFAALPDQERKAARQQAKAVNFGLPGGLGAESLARYAKDSYGVDMTPEQAKEMRTRMCADVYPELGQYLAGGYANNVSVCTLTGRIRSGCGYTQARNTPFSGLAADGAKLACFELVRKGFRVVGFVHDEVLIELPAGSTQEDIEQVQNILAQAMRRCTPDIPITTSAKLGSCWEH